MCVCIDGIAPLLSRFVLGRGRRAGPGVDLWGGLKSEWRPPARQLTLVIATAMPCGGRGERALGWAIRRPVASSDATQLGGRSPDVDLGRGGPPGDRKPGGGYWADL